MKAIDQCKTLQDFKDLVAIRKQWVDFKDFYDFYKKLKEGERFIMKMTDEAAELYARYRASSKVNQSLQLAADRATTKMQKGRNGCKIVVDPESILNLLPELIETINKEI